MGSFLTVLTAEDSGTRVPADSVSGEGLVPGSQVLSLITLALPGTAYCFLLLYLPPSSCNAEVCGLYCHGQMTSLNPTPQIIRVRSGLREHSDRIPSTATWDCRVNTKGKKLSFSEKKHKRRIKLLSMY